MSIVLTIFILAFFTAYTGACLGEMGRINRPPLYWNKVGQAFLNVCGTFHAIAPLFVLILCLITHTWYINLAIGLCGILLGILSASISFDVLRATSPIWGTFGFIIVLLVGQPAAPLFRWILGTTSGR